jgi:hypothetical protein
MRKKLIIVYGQGRSGTTRIFRFLARQKGISPLRSEAPELNTLSALAQPFRDSLKSPVAKYSRRHGVTGTMTLLSNWVIFKLKIFGLRECIKLRMIRKVFLRSKIYVTNVPVDPKVPLDLDILKKKFDIVTIGVQRDNRDVLLSRVLFPGFDGYSLTEHVDDIARRNEIYAVVEKHAVLRFASIADDYYLIEQLQTIVATELKATKHERVHPTIKDKEAIARVDNFLKENPDVEKRLEP